MSATPMPVPPRAAAAPPKSLAAKLAEIMAAVERIPKNGRNEFHHYDYATEADIVSAIRGELASRAVMLIPSITGESRHPVGEKGSVLTVLEMEMEFLDGDSGESIKKPWRGYGTDKEDKGGYKAMTGGEKYFLMKCFLVPTGDDPETDEAVAKKPAPARTVPPTRPAPAGKPRTSGPDDPLPRSSHTYTVTGVKQLKTGMKGNTPWTMFGITVNTGQTFLTFSSTVADQADAAAKSGQALEIDTEPAKKGNDRIIIDLAPAQGPA